MSDPTFGISITRIDNEPRPAVWSDMAVVGIVGTAPDADASVFPLNTPVFMYSDDRTKYLGLGTDGTIADALNLINAQLGEFQVAAKCVIVRIAEGADVNATITNIVGDSVAKTGIHAFVEAGPLLGVIPRLICAPGFTSQRDTGVSAITVANSGSGYTSAPTVTVTGGGGIGATATATIADGEITGFTITNPGSGYETSPTVTLSGGGGSNGAGAAVIADLANPVCAALPAVCAKLLAHAVVDGPATTEQDAINWRETLNSDRLIPVDPAVKVFENGQTIVQPLSPAVIGIGVRRDHEKQGRPFHSWANQPVQGIIGPSRPINFSLTDGATEGQRMLAANIGVLLRGELGVETAIASGGFVFVGTDNAGEDDLWRFYNVSRGRDYIHLMFLRTLRFYLGRFNITGQTIQAVLNTMSFALRDLKADGDILGYEIKFTRDQNSPEQLRLGKFTINFAAEEAPVLRYLGIQSARYRPALDALLDDLLAQVDAVTG
ncbi:MAG: phage tail protein [Hyphomicrobium sp. 32-62-53]|nr:MAG: phage tail protein [Hyphomicrobium sp. 12-62-95]OYX99784.1 MAG: phage tail protein [Hyphomicrobium sp. 32-62-53]